MNESGKSEWSNLDSFWGCDFKYFQVVNRFATPLFQWHTDETFLSIYSILIPIFIFYIENSQIFLYLFDLTGLNAKRIHFRYCDLPNLLSENNKKKNGKIQLNIISVILFIKICKSFHLIFNMSVKSFFTRKKNKIIP